LSKINHCGGDRKPKHVYLLYTQEQRYDYEMVYLAYCPRCKQDIIETCGLSIDNGKGPVSRIKRKNHEDVLARVKANFCQELTKMYSPPRETRAIPLVSEYTLRISRGVESSGQEEERRQAHSQAYMEDEPLRR
jgi:hypothetical protein